ncbi:unnamed protein product [Colias eurytheme]|nr:unnamed protein product [Colias eurytheme]
MSSDVIEVLIDAGVTPRAHVRTVGGNSTVLLIALLSDRDNECEIRVVPREMEAKYPRALVAGHRRVARADTERHRRVSSRSAPAVPPRPLCLPVPRPHAPLRPRAGKFIQM